MLSATSALGRRMVVSGGTLEYLTAVVKRKEPTVNASTQENPQQHQKLVIAKPPTEGLTLFYYQL